MISNACTRMDIGASAGSVPPMAHPSLICGDSEEVIQVSITSGSAANSPWPQDGQAGTGGVSVSGSTGRSARRASTGAWHEAQNQTGNGTPYRRCRVIFQSHFSPSIQSSSRRRMNGGIHSSSAARARNRSAFSRTAMNHCGLIWNSTGVWHRSCTPTTCRTGTLPASSPASSSALTTAERPWVTASPANGPASSPRRPSGPRTSRSARWSRRQRRTSSLSPNVHTIISPVPYSGSTS